MKKGKTQDREALRRQFYAAIDAGTLDLRDSIRMFRKMLGMTQREFAEYAGVAPRIVIDFEQGRGNPTLQTLQKLLKGSGLQLKIGRKNSP